MTPIQPHKADSGAARTSPGRAHKIKHCTAIQRRTSFNWLPGCVPVCGAARTRTPQRQPGSRGRANDGGPERTRTTPGATADPTARSSARAATGRVSRRPGRAGPGPRGAAPSRPSSASRPSNHRLRTGGDVHGHTLRACRQGQSSSGVTVVNPQWRDGRQGRRLASARSRDPNTVRFRGRSR